MDEGLSEVVILLEIISLETPKEDCVLLKGEEESPSNTELFSIKEVVFDEVSLEESSKDEEFSKPTCVKTDDKLSVVQPIKESAIKSANIRQTVCFIKYILLSKMILNVFKNIMGNGCLHNLAPRI